MTAFQTSNKGSSSVVSGLAVQKLPEIIKALDQFKKRTSNNLVRRGLYAGGVVLRDEARRLVRIRTGALKKATVVKRGDPAKGQQSISFGIARVRFVVNQKGRLRKFGASTVKSRAESGLVTVSPRRYAHLVELGTSHSRAFSFIVKAADNKASAAVDAMVLKMSSDLDEEVRKLRT